tara:strand:- start:642 stop:1313 length:672 start_codon:yes stop_codon:yes gene_type:complete
MPHTPFHRPDYDEELAAQGRSLYEESTRGYAGAYASQNNLISYNEEQQAAIDEYRKSMQGGLPGRRGFLGNGLQQALGRGAGGVVGDFSNYLNDQGFSTQESLEFFKALDADPEEFFGSKIPKEKGEKIRFLKEYFKEAQNLYQASADTEKEMIREEKASREQLEFDKAQRTAFGLSDQQQGELADRQRKQQQSQQYLQSRGGMSSRQAQKSGMVMVPQSRPV